MKTWLISALLLAITVFVFLSAAHENGERRRKQPGLLSTEELRGKLLEKANHPQKFCLIRKLCL